MRMSTGPADLSAGCFKKGEKEWKREGEGFVEISVSSEDPLTVEKI